MGPPTEAHLRAVAAAEAGSPGTPADFFDALLVALDLFVKTVTERPKLASKVQKRIVLVRCDTVTGPMDHTASLGLASLPSYTHFN